MMTFFGLFIRLFVSFPQDFRRDPHGGRILRHIIDDNGVSAYTGMCADGYTAQDPRTSPDIDMSTNDRGTGNAPSRAYGDLLENQAVRADLSIRVDDYAVRMGHEKPTGDF